MTQARSAQRQENVHCGDAEFNMLASCRNRPFLGRRDVLVPAHIADLASSERAAATDPEPELSRYCHVGRNGRHPSSLVAVASRKLLEDQANGLLGREFPFLRIERCGAGTSFASNRRGPYALNDAWLKAALTFVGSISRPANRSRFNPRDMFMCDWKSANCNGS